MRKALILPAKALALINTKPQQTTSSAQKHNRRGRHIFNNVLLIFFLLVFLLLFFSINALYYQSVKNTIKKLGWLLIFVVVFIKQIVYLVFWWDVFLPNLGLFTDLLKLLQDLFFGTAALSLRKACSIEPEKKVLSGLDAVSTGAEH